MSNLRQPHPSPEAWRWIAGTPGLWARRLPSAVALDALARRLAPVEPHLIWLDSAQPHPDTGRWSLLAWRPWLIASSLDGVDAPAKCDVVRAGDDPLGAVRQLLRRYRFTASMEELPCAPGLLGLFGYELNRWIERLPSPKPAFGRIPDLVLYGMSAMVLVDHARGQSWCLGMGASKDAARRQAEACLELAEPCAFGLSLEPRAASRPVAPTEAGGLEPMLSRSEFEAMVRRAKTFIASGDIFQANLSQRFAGRCQASPLPLYLALRRVNPSPFACLLISPEYAIVSCSPERLVEARAGRVATRPIAGTRPRGATPADDVHQGVELLLSDKERAEHLMLVDLARNDLGRICRYGSVEVNQLMTLEHYSHVMHIVSNVQGALRPGVDAVDVLRALFPGGTITGCPKVRCMELIRELEPVARGPYTGSLGLLGFDGSVSLNILIRTLLLQDGQAWFHAGAGIVADSEPDREYEETLAKGRALVRALSVAAEAPSTALAGA